MLNRPLNLICPQTEQDELRAEQHIRDCCEEIQNHWTDKTRQIRSSSFHPHAVSVPFVNMRTLTERRPRGTTVS